MAAGENGTEKYYLSSGVRKRRPVDFDVNAGPKNCSGREDRANPNPGRARAENQATPAELSAGVVFLSKRRVKNPSAGG